MQNKKEERDQTQHRAKHYEILAFFRIHCRNPAFFRGSILVNHNDIYFAIAIIPCGAASSLLLVPKDALQRQLLIS
jgi:hypothetical protein